MLTSLERSLVLYLNSDTSTPFDTKTVPSAPPPKVEKPQSIIEPTLRSEEKTISTHDKYVEKLSAVPQFSNLGPLFKSSTPIELTESETEYVVKCVKHTFQNHMVLQFDCTNTLNDQLLEQVSVQVDASEGWDILLTIPCPSLPYGQPDTCYTLLAIPQDMMNTTCTFTATLKFMVRDCDPATGEPETDDGYQDDYTLEDLEITVTDHIQKVTRSNFGAAWDELGATNELEDTFALSSMSTLEEAVTQITEFLGMHPCDRSDRIPEGKSAHTLYLAGTYRGGDAVLVRAKLALADGVTMQLTVRSENPDVSEVIASAVG